MLSKLSKPRNSVANMTKCDNSELEEKPTASLQICPMFPPVLKYYLIKHLGSQTVADCCFFTSQSYLRLLH